MPRKSTRPSTACSARRWARPTRSIPPPNAPAIPHNVQITLTQASAHRNPLDGVESTIRWARWRPGCVGSFGSRQPEGQVGPLGLVRSAPPYGPPPAARWRATIDRFRAPDAPAIPHNVQITLTRAAAHQHNRLPGERQEHKSPPASVVPGRAPGCKAIKRCVQPGPG